MVAPSRLLPLALPLLGWCALTARASVGEQRARLPPPAACADAIEGVWRSYGYNPDRGAWSRFTLTIERQSGSSSALKGTIHNEGWKGDESTLQPPVCTGRTHFEVSMDARGSFQGSTVVFFGVGDWRMDELHCGGESFGYSLDRFTGQLDGELQEFQSVNNDGDQAINVPTVFRRTRCISDALEPKAVVPPPFQPSVGCGFW